MWVNQFVTYVCESYRQSVNVSSLCLCVFVFHFVFNRIAMIDKTERFTQASGFALNIPPLRNLILNNRVETAW